MNTRLGDMWGRKRIYLTGAAVFTLMSLLSGFAGGALVLILLRVLAGLGGAMVVANSSAIVTDAFPRREPTRYRRRQLLDLSLFRDRLFAIGNLTQGINGTARFGILFQGPEQFDPVKAGILVTPPLSLLRGREESRRAVAA